MPAMARLLAWFEAGGCKGAVLAGTNGEGPSLSAVEKRDLLRDAMPLRGKLELMLGVATPSLDEAVWLCKRADEFGAAAVLLMPPSYFREVSEAGIEAWFLHVLDRSPAPVLIYNFPKRTGITLSASLLARLGTHERMVGAKDSSGAVENLAAYADALPGKLLYVGDETLLLQALEAGWTGTISGAANVLPDWLSTVISSFGTESGAAKFELLLPLIEAIRAQPQPAANKALLHRWGVLPRADVRLPLLGVESVDELSGFIESVIGRR